MRRRKEILMRLVRWSWTILWVMVFVVGAHIPGYAVEALFPLSVPLDPITFQQGPGSTLASRYCLICHSAEYIYTQPPHSQERWTEIIQKMKHSFGCPLPEEEVLPLSQYLVNQNSVQPTPVRKNVATPEHRATDMGANAEKGKVVYDTYCFNCHGRTGKGDGPIGQSLVPPAADLTTTSGKSDNTLLTTIRNGRPGTAMPSWKNDLTSKDINNVLAYIRSLQK